MQHIRTATLEDLENIITLNEEIMVNNPSFDSDLIIGWALTPEGRKYFKEGIENKDGCFFLLLEDGQMIGYVNGGKFDIAYRKSKYFQIENIGVIPSKKGQGLGKLLLETVTSWAKKHDYQKIYLESYAQNTDAIEFYKRNGFTEIDTCLEKQL